MKKFVILIINIFIIILFSYESALAKTVDESIIRQIAQSFLKKRSTIHTQALNKQVVYSIDRIEQINHTTDNSLLAHIVHIQPKGFLIISPLLGNKPVIAYTFKHNWYHNIDENDFIYTLLDMDLDLRKVNLKKYSNENLDINSYDWDSRFKLTESSTLPQYWPDQLETETGGWIKTTWDQLKPHNNMCPIDTATGKRTEAGCLAIALAQIVNYHEYIADFKLDEDFQYYSSFNPRFHIDTDSSEFDFPSFLKLNSYLDDIRTKFITHEDLNDIEITALCFACGILLKTNYSSGFSAPYRTYEDADRISDKLRYGKARYEHYTSGSEFNNILINNIIKELPVILEIKSSAGGEAHAVIVDGYNTNGEFHLNFGWGDTRPNPIRTVWWNGIRDSVPSKYNRVMDAIVNITRHPMLPLGLWSNKTIVKLQPSFIGNESTPEIIKITNSGALNLWIYRIEASNNFVFEPLNVSYWPDLVPISLDPDESVDVKITCTPHHSREVYGKLQVFATYNYDQDIYLGINLIGEGKPGTWITGGDVSGTWKEESSPYYINADISIEEGESLIIEPGTEIIFRDSYAFTIKQNAQLIAKGAENDSIYFTAENKNKGWQGILIEDSGVDDTLAYCVLSDAKRTATNPLHINRGGVISIDNSSPTIAHSSIIKNQSKPSGGGMYLDNSNASISHLRFEENVAPQNGGALFMSNSSPTISNTIFCNNQAYSGGAIYAIKSSPTLTNVTIANNKATDDGGAIALDKECYIEVKNSIIWGNEVEGEGEGEGYTLAFLSSSGSSSISFNYSNIDTMGNDWLFTKGQEQIDWLDGIHCTDPFFTNPQNFIYTLQEGSPCIDAGNPDSTYNDPEDLPDNPGYARPPAMGTVTNDMGTYGGSDYFIPGAVRIERKFDIPPSNFMLYQNYPNPFNPKTVISYHVGANSNSPLHIDLSIYNILGQKVATLISRKQQAGFHTVAWNASGFTSGVYYYRLTTNQEFSKTKKLVLIR